MFKSLRAKWIMGYWRPLKCSIGIHQWLKTICPVTLQPHKKVCLECGKETT